MPEPSVQALEELRFSHVIATKGRPELLRDALDSVLGALPPNGEIIVIDGDPGRSGETVVKQVGGNGDRPPIRYIDGVSGLCSQRNAGIDAARGDVLVFTDDDCTLEAGFYEALAEVYRDPAVIGATGRVREPFDKRIGSNVESSLRRMVLGGGRQGTMTSYGFRRYILDVETPRSVEFMPGTFMSARHMLAAEIRFDEWLERLNGYSLGEDDDFSYRLSRRGTIRYVPAAGVYHKALGKHTIDRRALARLVVINRTYLFRKNFAETLGARLGFAALIAVFFGHRIVNRDWQGVRGLIDGLLYVRHRDLGAVGSVAPAWR